MKTRTRPDTLAQVDLNTTWQELALPKEPLRRLRGTAPRAKSRAARDAGGRSKRASPRSPGSAALFIGESKIVNTLAAKALAGELNKDLYRVDLSAVVSKYIGETEKNLKQLLDMAEELNAVLFFDEADALFGKRSEVKDSHDRYAQLDINYLLERLEAYPGLAIIATNTTPTIDPALRRRLRCVVQLPPCVG